MSRPDWTRPIDAMIRGRWALFGLVLLMGAMTRETALLMLPVAALVDAVRWHVSGRKVLDAIGREVERLVAVEGNVLEPPR